MGQRLAALEARCFEQDSRLSMLEEKEGANVKTHASLSLELQRL